MKNCNHTETQTLKWVEDDGTLMMCKSCLECRTTLSRGHVYGEDDGKWAGVITEKSTQTNLEPRHQRTSVHILKLKQLFCSHVFKETSQEVLYRAREAFGTKWGVTAYQTFIYAASNRQCVKCEKKTIVVLRSFDVDV